MMKTLLRIAFGAVVAALTACGDETQATTERGGAGDDGPRQVAIQFAARVGAEPFSCSSTYPGLGAEEGDARITELKAYVHGMRLVREDGTDVPLELDQDGTWQSGEVALLDFETGDGGCTHGTPETRLEVVGNVPAATYVGLRFRLGVPFDLNHTDVTTAPPPLDRSALYWGWGVGRMFLSLIAKVPTEENDNTFVLLLASIGCTGNPARGEVVSCERPNRAEIDLPLFDADTDEVVFDLEALLADSPLLTGGGCHADADSADECAAPYAQLGLDYASGAPITGQTAFRAQTRAP